MPIVSRFDGMEIEIRYREERHQLTHFHAYYGEYEALYSLEPIGKLAGSMPKKADAKIIEWAQSRQGELLKNWALAKAQKPLEPII